MLKTKEEIAWKIHELYYRFQKRIVKGFFFFNKIVKVINYNKLYVIEH